MKSQKGISLISLLVYVMAFLMIAGIIASITTFFYSNYSFLDDKTSVASEYNKLNLVLVEESKTDYNYVYKVGSADPDEEIEDYHNQYIDSEYILEDISNRCKENFNTYIVFSDQNFIGWKKDSEKIYYNQSVLCNDVKDFSIKENSINGKSVISIYVQFDNKSYTSKYTMK